MKIMAKLELLELKIAILLIFEETKFYSYLSNEGLVNGLSLECGSCEQQERHEKGVLRAAHPHTPFSGECPLGYEVRWQTISL